MLKFINLLCVYSTGPIEPPSYPQPDDRTSTMPRCRFALRNRLGYSKCRTVPEISTIRSFAATLLRFCRNFRRRHFDLLFADPPYNLTKNFGHGKVSARRRSDEYEEWLDSWLRLCVPLLKPTASSLYLRRLAFGVRRYNVSGRTISSFEPHHVGTRKRPRCESELEKRGRGHLVLYSVGRIHLQSRRRKTTPPRARSIRENGQPKDWNDGERQFSRHASVEHLDRHQRSVLVDAREHRPSDTKTRKAACQDHPREH